MKRRQFITLIGGAAAAWPFAAWAQQHKMLRVGFVGMQPREAPHYTNFLRRMAELGYQEGRNFTFNRSVCARIYEFAMDRATRPNTAAADWQS